MGSADTHRHRSRGEVPPTPRCQPTPPRWPGGKGCTAAEEEGPAEEQASSTGDNLPVKAPAPPRAAPHPEQVSCATSPLRCKLSGESQPSL